MIAYEWKLHTAEKIPSNVTEPAQTYLLGCDGQHLWTPADKLWSISAKEPVKYWLQTPCFGNNS